MAATRFFEINEASAIQCTDVKAPFDYTQIASLSALYPRGVHASYNLKFWGLSANALLLKFLTVLGTA